MEIQIQALETVDAPDHPVSGTTRTRYSFEITQNGDSLVTGESSVTRNANGVFLESGDLHKQVGASYLRKGLIAAVRKYFSETSA